MKNVTERPGESKDTEEQKLRSEYRLQFLNLLRELEKRKIEALTIEGNQVTCEFQSINRCCDQLAVSQLQTPVGQVKRALLRTQDFQYFRFNAYSE